MLPPKYICEENSFSAMKFHSDDTDILFMQTKLPFKKLVKHQCPFEKYSLNVAFFSYNGYWAGLPIFFHYSLTMQEYQRLSYYFSFLSRLLDTRCHR